jgi:hypothetical protein
MSVSAGGCFIPAHPPAATKVKHPYECLCREIRFGAEYC